MDLNTLDIAGAVEGRLCSARYRGGTRTAPAAFLAQVVLIALVTVTPWFFGGVQARVQVWLFVGVMVALACCVIKQFADSSASAGIPWAIVPLIAAVGLGIVQLIPLGAKASEFLSPGGAQSRSTLLPTEGSSDVSLAENLGIPAESERQPLSLYPASTRHDLALLFLGISVFFAGASFFNGPKAQVWLCGLVAVNGAAIAFFGFIQKLTWDGLLYWSVPLTQGGGPFGPFVNQNNAGGFLNLGLAGALGMTVWAIARGRSGVPPGAESHPTEKRRTRTLRRRNPAFSEKPGFCAARNLEVPVAARFGQQLLEFISRLNASTLTSLSLAGLIVAGILCSLSRGAGIAMVGATIVTILTVLCARGRTLRLWVIAVAATVGLGLVSWVGMRESVYARLATLFDREVISQHDLIPHWQEGLDAVPHFWQTGSGLGTYRYVYGQYQDRLAQCWYYYAENQYVEALVEGGIVGLGLMLMVIGLVATAAWRLLRHGADARTLAFGIAGTFALTGQAIAGFFDFGLHIPANMVLFALFGGALSGGAVRLAKRQARRSSVHAEKKPGFSEKAGFLSVARCRETGGWLVAPLLAATLFAGNLWGCTEIRNAAAVETVLKDLRVAQMSKSPAAEDLVAGIEQLASAIEHRPDDAEAHRRMAELWIYLYRLRTLEQLRAETTLEADDPRLAQATSPLVIHHRVSVCAQHNRIADLERLRREPVVANHLIPALEHLVLSRRSCVLIPGVHLMMAQLCGLVADPAQDRIHIERARRLAPGDPDLLFVCGLLDLQAGRFEPAWESWQRSLTLSPRYLDDVLRIAGWRLETPGMIEQLLPNSPKLLVELTQQQYQGERHAKVRGRLLDRAEELIPQTDLPEDERYRLRGSVCALKEDYPEAIENYARAVELRSHEVAWRYEFAILLQRQGLLDQAHQQAKWCARLAPRDDKYRRLLQELHETKLR